MKKGYLSTYFEGIAWKELTLVEADPVRSNQHEFQGSKALREILGTPKEKITFPAKFVFLTDEDPIFDSGFLTWSDVRRNKPDRSAEYHLYYSNTEVTKRMSPGDFLVIAKCRDGSLLVVISEKGSTATNQVQWLFNISTAKHPGFSVRAELESNKDQISFTSRIILETIGIEVEDPEETLLDVMLDRFGYAFPDTRTFSTFTRSTLPEIDPVDCPDSAIVAWIEREMILFSTLERHLIGERLQKGFVDETGSPEVEGFFRFSKSVQNARKSRAGLALENHLEELFSSHGLNFDRGKITENTSKPDFIFPGQKEYRDSGFPSEKLSVLGVKTTCKDRWRQVLAEANRIDHKHLLTMEPGISTNQTNEMKSKKLQLVIPQSLYETYTVEQQKWLMNIREFIELVRSRQTKK